jgi:hypothetical protein
MAGFCEHEKEPSEPINGRNFITNLATTSSSRNTLLSGISDLYSSRIKTRNSNECQKLAYTLILNHLQ